MQRSRRDALVALSAGVVLALSILILNAGTPSSSSPSTCLPCGSLFAFSGSTDASSGTVNWYNMTVESVTPSITLGSISFDLESPNGSKIAPPGSGVNIVQINGPIEASYAFAESGTYELGFSADTPITGSDLISVYLFVSEQASSLVGYVLIAHVPEETCAGPIT